MPASLTAYQTIGAPLALILVLAERRRDFHGETNVSAVLQMRRQLKGLINLEALLILGAIKKTLRRRRSPAIYR